ncbi:MAG: hypothetical protein A2135_12065 [Actinobacteria bacterium RBG_16_67_15]|nr:MAG: hypothetical protein A2135_12065 [Actinobacteria bacterium RBG_16_67_15]
MTLRSNPITSSQHRIHHEEVEMTNFMVLATVPVVWAIGIVLIIAGIVYLTRGRMLLGGVLTVLGILMGGLNVLDTFG